MLMPVNSPVPEVKPPRCAQYTVKRGAVGRLARLADVECMRVQVAIKFFLDNNAFRCEEAACAVPQLRKGMNSLIMLDAAQKVCIPSRCGSATAISC